MSLPITVNPLPYVVRRIVGLPMMPPKGDTAQRRSRKWRRLRRWILDSRQAIDARASGFYIEDKKGNPIPFPRDVIAWAKWMERFRLAEKLHVAEDFVDDIRVSTVFLGIDHNFFRVGPPLVYETMVFAPKSRHDLWQHRTSTRAEAAEAHAEALALVHSGYFAPMDVAVTDEQEATP